MSFLTLLLYDIDNRQLIILLSILLLNDSDKFYKNKF
jgi:hypothetical protein